MVEVLSDPGGPSNAHLISRIRLIEGDITAQHDVDAIVTSVGTNMNMEGSLNRAIVKAAGQTLDEFILENIYDPKPGDIAPVPPFGLKVKHLFIAFTPPWDSDFGAEERHLLRCYRGALETARRMNLRSIAFPVLGTGKGKFPLPRACRLAVNALMERLDPSFTEIRIVCNRKELYQAFEERLKKTGWKGYKKP